MNISESELIAITDLFNIPGTLESIIPYGSGHINKTYLSSWRSEDGPKRYVHQSINESVFQDIPGLMQNISAVLRHLSARQSAGCGYLNLDIVPAKNGALFARDKHGLAWRTLNFLEGTCYYETANTKEQVYEAGRILGYFQSRLLDLDVSILTHTIKNFTSSSFRFSQLQTAISRGNPERIRVCKPEIDLALAQSGLFKVFDELLAKKEIPVRTIHGDPKLNNFCFDSLSGKAVCLIDLDTCMPGYSLYDFGDLARNTSISAAEDEQDFSKITYLPEFYEALVRGYSGHTKTFLNEKEVSLLHIAPQLLALTLGTRFLSDYINGDVYFKVQHAEHNLERARTQFQIFKIMQENESLMQAVTPRYFQD